jgi:hypothetical protein
MMQRAAANWIMSHKVVEKWKIDGLTNQVIGASS